GLNLIFGVIRIVNFAHGEFVMVAMYGTYLCHAALGLDPYLAVIVVVPAMFVLGTVVHRLVLQPLHAESSMQIFATFGLLIVLQNIVLWLTRGEGYSVPSKLAGLTLGVGDIRVTMSRLVIFATLTLTAIALHVFLKRTLIGKSIRAVTQDRQAARLMGINVERTFTVTFGIGTALAGLAGVLLAPIYTLAPDIGGNFILAAFAVVVLGGLGSVAGAYFGGLIVGLVEAFAGFYIDPELKQAIWFLIFIAVLIVRPSGLFGHVGAEEVGFREQG
ncbi:MAG: branched-chain amino acid ABC transporter permease, partial [Betaproteobacteria bacterium]|nr:branched-chain amino acid ABC transporter permease [Betaproteobacteria bacterium]